MASFLTKLFSGRILRRLEGVVLLVNDKEKEIEKLSSEELKEKSLKLREEVKSKNGDKEVLEEVLPEAFALVREAAKRELGQRHFDVQLMGGMVLHEGKIAEMLTGEGKTLVATLPTYLNALTGRGVHVVTVNDYLARRDTVWMGQIYHSLGLKISCIIHDTAYLYDPEFLALNRVEGPALSESKGEVSDLDKERDEVGSFRVIEKFLRPINRKEAYLADITYGTNHEFGFDFLRDNLTLKLADKVQRGHNYAIIDEVDSILIDEARTPLIIAAPDAESSEFYKTFAKVVEALKPEEDYAVDEKIKSVNITEAGLDKVEKMISIKNIFDPANARLVHFLQESLKAKTLFKRDKEYMVKNGEILIVDEFTGRILYGRRYSGGLHQAIEAKENLAVRQENRTYATITIQNYFRLYQKIAGMTGTAQTSAEEFHKVYNLDVQSIPSNRPMVREDHSDAIYKTKQAKYEAIVEAVKEKNKKGQPVLLGTTSITNNEIISDYLKRANVPHEVLNAKNNEREGEIIAQAGRLGAVTVATNMAGRGVDIVLGGNPPDKSAAERIKELGGLHIIGTERHEARRIDNQLRGRSGRQGDPGSSRFFLSLEDDLTRIFGGDRLKALMERFNFPSDIPIESSMVSRVVNQAQAKVEGANFDIRHHLLDFDDVLNKQRKVVYDRRAKFLRFGEENKVRPILEEIFEKVLGATKNQLESQPNEEGQKQFEEFNKKVAAVPTEFEPLRSAIIGQHLARILDMLWVDHLENLDGLRESVNIRAYGQHEPLVEYRREAHQLFQALEKNFETIVFNTVFQVFDLKLENLNQPTQKTQAPPPEFKSIGRNDPCWCGSGEKYKKCHGK
ncbi:MAG: preprotein translocase subunit SecA [Patescibacteria group bacterium]